MIRKPNLHRWLVARGEVLRLNMESGFATRDSPEFARLSKDTADMLQANLRTMAVVNDMDGAEVLQTLAAMPLSQDDRLKCVSLVNESMQRGSAMALPNRHNENGVVVRQEMFFPEKYLPPKLWAIILDEKTVRDQKTLLLARFFWELGFRRPTENGCKNVVVITFANEEEKCTVDAVLYQIRVYKQRLKALGAGMQLNGMALPNFSDGDMVGLKSAFPEMWERAYQGEEPQAPCPVSSTGLRNLQCVTGCRSSKNGCSMGASRGFGSTSAQTSLQAQQLQFQQMQQMQFQQMMAAMLAGRGIGADPIPDMRYTSPRPSERSRGAESAQTSPVDDGPGPLAIAAEASAVAASPVGAGPGTLAIVAGALPVAASAAAVPEKTTLPEEREDEFRALRTLVGENRKGRAAQAAQATEPPKKRARRAAVPAEAP